MVNNNKYFYISGFISISLFLLFVSLFFYMMVTSVDIKSYALKKENYISVSLDIVSATKKKNTKAILKKVEEVKEIETPEILKKPNINNLFSKIATKKIKKEIVEKPKEIVRNLDELSKKIKITSENKTKPLLETNDKVNNISDKNSKVSTGDVVNEYNAKINALVHQKFYPPENSQGSEVQVIIELSSLGKLLDFRVLKYSSNDALNKVVDNMKEKLMSVIFPISPNNNSQRIIINLIPK